MIKIRATGTDLVNKKLYDQNAGIIKYMRKWVHRAADRIVREAKLNTPVDYHNLEESIKQERSLEGTRHRLVIHITAGGMVGGVNVDEYATRVHENYDADVEAGRGPGEGTLEKMAANPGRHIGSKFLERPAEDERKKWEAGLAQAALDQAVKEVT